MKNKKQPLQKARKAKPKLLLTLMLENSKVGDILFASKPQAQAQSTAVSLGMKVYTERVIMINEIRSEKPFAIKVTKIVVLEK